MWNGDPLSAASVEINTLVGTNMMAPGAGEGFVGDARAIEGAHCRPPRCIRSRACSTDGQCHNIRLPFKRTQGIFPALRHAMTVPLETGTRVSSVSVSMNPAGSPGGECATRTSRRVCSSGLPAPLGAASGFGCTMFCIRAQHRTAAPVLATAELWR